jgi:hypothetical protein
MESPKKVYEEVHHPCWTEKPIFTRTVTCNDKVLSSGGCESCFITFISAVDSENKKEMLDALEKRLKEEKCSMASVYGDTIGKSDFYEFHGYKHQYYTGLEYYIRRLTLQSIRTNVMTKNL